MSTGHVFEHEVSTFGGRGDVPIHKKCDLRGEPLNFQNLSLVFWPQSQIINLETELLRRPLQASFRGWAARMP